jgi:1,4-dihydroxy-2-naphthoate octaprenyltransferase
MKNKFAAVFLIIAGVLTGIVDHNWTAFVIFLIPAVTIFFSKYDWTANKYGDPMKMMEGK